MYADQLERRARILEQQAKAIEKKNPSSAQFFRDQAHKLRVRARKTRKEENGK